MGEGQGNVSVSAELAKNTGFAIENQHCVRYEVDGTLLARQGSVIAYRGDLTIKTKSQGVRKLVKRAVTGEGLALMEVQGRGRIWLAEQAKNVMTVRGDALTVTGKSVLAFESTLEYDIRLLKGAGMSAGGLVNTVFRGEGALAIMTHGQPVELAVTPDAPVFVDTDAVIGWTSTLDTSVHRSESAMSWLKGGSGEMYQLRLEGTGTVLVQPSEGPPAGEKGKSGVLDTIGEFV